VFFAGAVLSKPEANACSPAIFWGEIYSGFSQGALNSSEIVEAWDPTPALEIPDC
jgi:hypothetical protein